MQLFAKFKIILRRGFRATLNFQKYYVKMLVYPITALKFDTGGLDVPPAGECQGSLEKR